MRGRRFTPDALKVIEALGETPEGMDLRQIAERTELPARAVASVLKRLVHIGHVNSVKCLKKTGWRRYLYTVNVVPRLRESASGRLAPPKVVADQAEGLELLNKAFGIGRPQLPVRPRVVKRWEEEGVDEPLERVKAA